MSILSRTVLCGAIVACLSSAATVEALVQLPRRDIETYDKYQQRHSSVIMIGVLLVFIIFTVLLILYWRRSRQTENCVPCHAWQDLEKQKAMHNEVFQNAKLSEPAPVVHSTKENQKAMHNEVFQNVEHSEPAPVVHSTKENQKAMHSEVFLNVELSEPTPVMHSTEKNRSSDTWDKYLSMIKSPSRLNSVVGKMSTMDKNI